MKRLLARIAPPFLALALAGGAATRAQAQTFTVVHTFTDSPDGAVPFAGLLIDAAGNLYGTTLGGGCTPLGCGTIFSLDPSGNETVLSRFGVANPAVGGPRGTLIRDGAGNLFGTARDGGAFGNGTVFKLDPSGNLMVLHSFQCVEGANPYAGLAMDAAGNLYGTASSALACGVAGGTVFKIDPAGNFVILHTFTGPDGAGPTGGLILDAAGNLYGTAGGGGTGACPDLAGFVSPCGLVFKLDPAGNETILYNFQRGADGGNPFAGLLMDAAGNLYGTTVTGGSGTSGICSGETGLPGCGTVFKVDPFGNETVLYSFKGGSDGALPQAGVIMDAAGNLYGVTSEGGPGPCTSRNQVVVGCGIAFKLDPLGNETILYTFTGGSDGAFPLYGHLVMDTTGNLYGTASGGGFGTTSAGGPCTIVAGLGGCGTVFKLTPVSPVSNPPTIIVSFPAPPSGQDGFFKAGQTPVVGSVSASDPSNVTAISCSDSLGGLTAGGLTGGGTTSARESLSVNGDGIHAISCTAMDGAGNSGAAPGSVNMATIDIDTTPPAIMFSGNQGTYTVDQTVSITTTATDALSGVATLSTQPLPNSSVTCATGTRCVNFTAPAHSLGPGTHTISATATDGAGNAASASTSFTVLTPQQATQRIINSVNTLFSQGVINAGQDNSLLAQLQHAITMMNAGKNDGAIGNLDSFISEVNDLLSSGVLSPSQAASLTSAAQGVIASL